MHLWVMICGIPFKVTVTMTFDLVSRIIMSGT